MGWLAEQDKYHVRKYFTPKARQSQGEKIDIDKTRFVVE
jgi:hypothetical protein